MDLHLVSVLEIIMYNAAVYSISYTLTVIKLVLLSVYLSVIIIVSLLYYSSDIYMYSNGC